MGGARGRGYCIIVTFPLYCSKHVTSYTMFQVIRVASFLEDKLVTQDITDDPERNTVLIVVGEVTDIEDFKSTVNLHDFNTVSYHNILTVGTLS